MTKAVELSEALKESHPGWTVTAENGYSNHAYLIVEARGVTFAIRSTSQSTLSLSGVYGNLAKYIQEGDDLPRLDMHLPSEMDVFVNVCSGFMEDVGFYLTVLKRRMSKANGNYATRLEIAKKLEGPGIKITGATDIWCKKKTFEVSGEILSNGSVSLSIVCDGDTAARVLKALRKE